MTTTTADLLLRDVRLGLHGPLRDVAVAGGSIVTIAPRASGLDAAEQLNAGGATLLRGLWDRHVHLRHWALRRGSIDLSGVRAVEDAVAALRAARRDVVFAFGAAEALVRALADAPGTDELPDAVLVLALDLHTAWANEAAVRRAGLDRPGVLREQDCFAVASRLGAQADVEADVLAALDDAAALGVVGVLDFEMADNVTDWPRRAAEAGLPVRIDCSIPRDRLDAAIAAGLRTGDPLDGRTARDSRVRVGPVKIFADGSLGSATALCTVPYPGPAGDHGRQEIDPTTLTDLISRAGVAGIACAVHAIGDRANEIALDAFAAAGVGGRIEHTQLVRSADLGRFAALGVVAGVQPAHLLDDRDLADELWAGQPGLAYAYSALSAAGATVEFGSDAPVSPLDPWLGIRAAVRRTGDERPAWHPEQRLTAAAALDASTGGRATPRNADTADLVVVDLHEDDTPRQVVATTVAGAFTHRG